MRLGHITPSRVTFGRAKLTFKLQYTVCGIIADNVVAGTHNMLYIYIYTHTQVLMYRM